MASSKSKESGNLEQFPTLIVMTGPSTSKKSKIAHEISTYLQYPLINQPDIAPVLDNYIQDLFINTTCSDLTFKIITQIASTQLDSKLRVIISTPLSENEFIQLVQLVSSKSSSLIIIEHQDNALPFDVHGIDNVQNLSIDMEKTFKVEDFAPKLLGIVESRKKVDLGDAFENKESEGSSSTILSFDEKIRKQWHSHEFSIISDTNQTFEKFLCNNCEDLVSGATYKCIECDEFILHKKCAEFSIDTHNLKMKYPWFLSESTLEFYDFPRKQKCKLCDKFSIACPNCLFQSHIESNIFPTILRYEGHEHLLNFVIMPSWVNFIYKCCKCNELGNTASYKCYNCNFDIHLTCALPLLDMFEYVMIAPPRLVNYLREKFPDSMSIIGRRDLRFMPYQLKSCTTLKGLGIYGFDEVEVLPEWLGNFSSLEKLAIGDCKNMKIGTALQGLSQLSYLGVSNCPLLKQSCAKESGSEWSKISHIPNIEIDD